MLRPPASSFSPPGLFIDQSTTKNLTLNTHYDLESNIDEKIGVEDWNGGDEKAGNRTLSCLLKKFGNFLRSTFLSLLPTPARVIDRDTRMNEGTREGDC